MSTITPSVQPGYFLDHQTVNFSFSNDVTEVAMTIGNIPPSLSKYIAYDKLIPPNPFIAVTEDGRGRVVYDGGFPKFYNNNSYTGATTFAQLNASCKFLHNAIHWVKNTTKWNSGNRKILFISDCFDDSEHYSIKATYGDGFYNTLTQVARVVGATPTFKTCSDWGGNTNGKIDIRLAELEQYAAVIFFGSFAVGPGGGLPSISAQSINDFVTYRENGNGLILITDHGVEHGSIGSAESEQIGYSFFATINKLATRFGTYFSGNYDRLPVNVGFLRANYGDHPLYNNLLDSEDIYASGSESRVFVSETTVYPPNGVPPFITTLKGQNTVNILVRSNDGSMTTARYVYIVAGDEILFVKSSDGTNQIVNTSVLSRRDGSLDFTLETNGQALGTLWGELLLNGIRIGSFSEENGVTSFNLFAGTQTRSRPGDAFVVRMMTPFSYTKKLDVISLTPSIANSTSLSQVNRAIGVGYGVTHQKALTRARDVYNTGAEFKHTGVSIHSLANLFRSVLGGTNPSTNKYSCAMHGTDAEAISSVTNGGKPLINHAFNYNTGALIAWYLGGARVISGVHAKHILPAKQIIVSNGEPGTWQLNDAGNFVKIA